MCLKEMAEENGLRTLCENVCDNTRLVTRLTNGLVRIGIKTVEDFMVMDIDDCMNRITKVTGIRNSEKTRETLMKMKEINN